MTDERRFATNLLFDASGFDPTVALRRKRTVAADADVDGKVWGWAFRRPKPGATPLVAYAIGGKGPRKRVWTDPDGSVVQVEPTRRTRLS